MRYLCMGIVFIISFILKAFKYHTRVERLSNFVRESCLHGNNCIIHFAYSLVIQYFSIINHKYTSIFVPFIYFFISMCFLIIMLSIFLISVLKRKKSKGKCRLLWGKCVWNGQNYPRFINHLEAFLKFKKTLPWYGNYDYFLT